MRSKICNCWFLFEKIKMTQCIQYLLDSEQISSNEYLFPRHFSSVRGLRDPPKFRVPIIHLSTTWSSSVSLALLHHQTSPKGGAQVHPPPSPPGLCLREGSMVEGCRLAVGGACSNLLSWSDFVARAPAAGACFVSFFQTRPSA